MQSLTERVENIQIGEAAPAAHPAGGRGGGYVPPARRAQTARGEAAVAPAKQPRIDEQLYDDSDDDDFSDDGSGGLAVPGASAGKRGSPVLAPPVGPSAGREGRALQGLQHNNMATSAPTCNVAKKPAPTRVDPSDGKAYPFASFQEVYGKDADRLWRLAGGSHGGASSYPASRYS
jgi:hypothetical protein